MTELTNREEERSRTAFAVTVFLMYLFFLFSNLNIYLYFSLKESFYVLLVPVLTAWTLCFPRLRGRWEYRLMLLYCLWFLLSRMLNHNPALTEDFGKTVDVFLQLPFLSLGLCLRKEERRKFLNVFSAVIGGFYFVLGLVCIYTFLTRVWIVNPITEQFICRLKTETGFSRLLILDINPDTTSCWYMNSFLLMVYQFFACRKKGWRIPILLSALVDYLVLGLNYVRSTMVALALVMGVLGALLVYRKLREKGKAIAVIGLIAAVLICLPAVYLTHEAIFRGFGHLSIEMRYPEATAEEKQEYYIRDYTNPKVLMGDSMTEVSNGRNWIYRSAFVAIRQDPTILLRGTLTRDTTELATDYLVKHGRFEKGEDLPHFQNYLLQVMVMTGLPGLLLALAVSLLLLLKSIRMFFSDTDRLPIGEACLMLPVLAAMLYGMFEITYFTNADHCSLFFFLLSGFFLGTYYDRFDTKQERKPD